MLVIGQGAEKAARGEMGANDPSLVCRPSLPEEGNLCSRGDVAITIASCGKAEPLNGTASGERGVSDLKLLAMPESLLSLRPGT
jgi:hypothetical protein